MGCAALALLACGGKHRQMREFKTLAYAQRVDGRPPYVVMPAEPVRGGGAAAGAADG